VFFKDNILNMNIYFLKPAKGLIKAFALASAFIFISSQLTAQVNGEEIFKNYCSSCHKVDGKSTGPWIKGSRDRWAAQSSMDNLYKWVKNSADVIKSGDPYAVALFNEWKQSPMTAQPLNNEQIDAVLDYVDNWVSPVAPGPTTDGAATVEKESDAWVWVLIISILFVIVILAVGSVRRQLHNAIKENKGEETDDELSYLQMFGQWANKNKILVGLSSLVILLTILISLGNEAMQVGVFEGYNPSQPIEFDHSVHAGKAEINCVYCHSSAEKSKHAGIPSVNVCMNCHRDIHKGQNTGTEEIAKIHAAAGYDPDQNEYTKDATPIIWNKVHNLPDHVYFNHSQHVVVGKIDCAQCHGDVKNIKTGKVATIAELNAVPENTIKFTKQVLTMGWCLECHNQAGVQDQGSAYYDEIHKRLKDNPELLKKFKQDDKITVRELGGWECAKCHY
jgi:mono/diheme cytochrome c family protein